MSHQTTSYHIISYHIKSYHIKSFSTTYHMSYYVSYRIMSYHTTSFHVISFVIMFFCCPCLDINIHVWICTSHTCITHILMFGWMKSFARKPALTVLNFLESDSTSHLALNWSHAHKTAHEVWFCVSHNWFWGMMLGNDMKRLYYWMCAWHKLHIKSLTWVYETWRSNLGPTHPG